MTKDEALERLCALASKVGEKAYNNRFAHDCFCGLNPLASAMDFQFDEPVLRFIECAVDEALAKKNKED